MLRTTVNSLQFSLRRKWFGKLKLRSGLPEATPSELEEKFYRSVLEKALPLGGEWADSVIDVGCRDWSYSGALAGFFTEAALLGIELDASRRYWNLYRRADQAEAFANRLRQKGRLARTLEGNFLELLPQTAHCSAERELVITFFYPFVSLDPCLGWGLPKRYAQFLPLLEHSKTLFAQSAPSSAIVSCHQGEWEAEIAEAAYAKAGFKTVRSVVGAEEYREKWPGMHDAYIFRTEADSASS